MEGNIPQEMLDAPRWCVWKYVHGKDDKLKKVPFQVSGQPAATNKPDTFTDYETAIAAVEDYEGLGFLLGDGFAGVDLDDCVDAEGNLNPAALGAVNRLDSYTERSSSGNGVKVFVLGDVPSGCGRKRGTLNGTKAEMYSAGRYFTVTRGQLAGTPDHLREAQVEINAMRAELQSEGAGSESNAVPPPQVTTPDDVPTGDTPLEQCKQQLAGLPDSISGESGHDRMFHAACEVRRWQLDEDESREALDWFSERKCLPAWSSDELDHKWESATKAVPTPEQEFADELANPSTAPQHDEESSPRRPKKFHFISCAELDNGDYRVKELIRGTMVEEQPLIIAGPQKSLKTNVLIDAAVSLATGEPMLGSLEVVAPTVVVVMSGESGMGTIQETARRVASSKGLQLADITGIHWTPTLPNLGDPNDSDELAGYLKDVGGRVLVIDPAYLTVDGSDSANLMAQGKLLAPMREACQRVGATFALAHHTKRQTSDASGSPLKLSDIAWAGFPEFAGQWWLLNRRKDYVPDSGTHELWLSIGSRVGFSSAWALDIEEGIWTPDTPRRWDVGLTSRAAVLAGEQSAMDVKRSEKHREQMLVELAKHPNGETFNNLRDHSKVPTDDARVLLDTLVSEGLADTCQVVRGNGQSYSGFRPKSPGDGSSLHTAA